MNKKKLLIASGIILVIVIIAIFTIIFVNKYYTQINSSNNEKTGQNVKVVGKLEEYIHSLTDNYYIKYSGKFSDDTGKVKDCIVEYTKDKNNYALKANDINLHVVCKGQNIYSVSYNYKIIVKMLISSMNVAEYNLASNIGQTYVKTYNSNEGEKEYIVEEYVYDTKPLKYFFEFDELKFIRYDDKDIKILRVERKTNTGLFMLPDGYNTVHAY